MIPLPTPCGPFGKIDAPPEVREPTGTRGYVDRGRERNERKTGVHRDRGTVLGDDRSPERS